MQFKEVIGQHNVKQALVRMVDSGRISHAQLFVGGEGYGALPLAIALAQYLNCESRSGGDSCGKCASCVQSASLAHPDINFIFPVATSKSAQSVGEVDGKKPVSDHFIEHWRKLVISTGGYFSEQMWYKTINIDNKQGLISRHEASEIIRKLSFKAFESKYKVVIMWLPESMNDQSANALLKILEEPWENTLFLMVSELPDKLLKTIISRTQEVNVTSIATPDIAEWLITNNLTDEDEAENIARLSLGNLLEAQRMATQESDGDENFLMFVSLMRLAFEAKHIQLLEWAESAAAMGREAQKNMLENSIRLFRDTYMLSMGVDKVSYLHGAEYKFCKKFAPYLNNSNIETLISETELLIRQISQNANPKIAFAHYVLLVSKLIVRI